jgi:hypothetical protein
MDFAGAKAAATAGVIFVYVEGMLYKSIIIYYESVCTIFLNIFFFFDFFLVGLLDGSQKIGSSLTGIVMGIIYERFGSQGWLVSLMPAAVLGALLLIPVIGRKGGEKKKKET